MHSPARSASPAPLPPAAIRAFASSLSPPKRSPRPAASRTPTIRGSALTAVPEARERRPCASGLHDLPLAVLHDEDREQAVRKVAVRIECDVGGDALVVDLRERRQVFRRIRR